MILRTLIVFMMGLVLPLNLRAQSVNDVFMALPDSVLPYLQQSQRKDLIALKMIEPSATAKITNMFKHEAELKAMEEDYLLFSIKEVQLEMLRLPVEGSDSVYCMLLTTQVPQKETICRIYDADGRFLYDIPFAADSLICHPESMKQSEYEELVKLIDFPIIEASVNKDAPFSLNVKLNVSSLSKEDAQRVKSVLLQKNVKWTGKTFN